VAIGPVPPYTNGAPTQYDLLQPSGGALILRTPDAGNNFQQLINVGSSPGDQTGDPGRLAWQKANLNFTQLYGRTGAYSGPTPAEVAANIPLIDTRYAPGNWLRYGADPLGVKDSTNAINNANLASSDSYGPAGTYVCSASIFCYSNQVMRGDGGATVLQYANDLIFNIKAVGVTNLTIRDLKISCTAAGSTGGDWAGIGLYNNSTFCKILNVEMTGLNAAGVWIQGGSYNLVDKCYFHNFSPLASGSGHACVDITEDSAGLYSPRYNVVSNCLMNPGVNTWFGIAFEQFYATTVVPQYNLAIGNRIGATAAYGILGYNVATNTDCFNQIIGNYIENTVGSVLTAASGMGIYIAGQGGTLISGNTVRNCMTSTTSATLVPGAIGLNLVTGLSPFTITGNTILNPQNFDGIRVTNAVSGGTISDNAISLQTGTPGNGITVLNSSNVVVTNNTINILNSLSNTIGILVNANAASMSNIALCNNNITGCAIRGIRFVQTGSVTITSVTIMGNVLTGGATACYGLAFETNVPANGSVIGNSFIASGTAPALFVSGAQNIRYEGNYLQGPASLTVQTTGTCTGSFFGLSNIFAGGAASMSNGATGFLVEWQSNAAPGSGTWAVGDRTEQSVPAVGSPKGWRCTVAGTPGTWVSEDNLLNSVYLRATAIETRSSTVTLTNSTYLTYAIPVAGTYQFRIAVFSYFTTAVTDGITANVNYSGTFTAVGSYLTGSLMNGTTTDTGIQPVEISSTVNNALAGLTMATYGASVAAATPAIHLIEGQLIATGTGTLAFAFAQSTSGVDTTNLGVGSYMIITKLS
jgi:parallel beta helix pectate lyase-like protein